MTPVVFHPIGTLRTPFTESSGTPIQPSGARGVRGSIELLPEFAEGLKDIDGFSHLVLLYYFDRSSAPRLRVVPYLDHEERGVFATRAPSRPNALGISVVRLLAVDGARLEIEDVDMLDGTPLLDIKPYVPSFDAEGEVRVGWLASRDERARRTRADDRF